MHIRKVHKTRANVRMSVTSSEMEMAHCAWPRSVVSRRLAVQQTTCRPRLKFGVDDAFLVIAVQLQSRMTIESKHRYPAIDEPGPRTADTHVPGSSGAIATLCGRQLLSNRGIPLNLDWVDQVRINTSAVERRAQS